MVTERRNGKTYITATMDESAQLVNALQMRAFELGEDALRHRMRAEYDEVNALYERAYMCKKIAKDISDAMYRR